MAYKWLPVTEDFDKTLVIKKWRFDVSCPISGNYDGALAELPNIDIKTCWSNSQPSNGYAFSNRFNLGQKYFSSRYYGWTDRRWTATTQAHTTLVSGTTYEFECPVDLYWAGNYSTPWNANIPNYMWFYVNSTTFETDVTAITGTYEASSYTVNLASDNAWTATTIPSWVTLSTTAGTSGTTQITVSFPINSAYSQRTGTIVFTDTENDTCEVECTQAKHPIIIPQNNIFRGGKQIS